MSGEIGAAPTAERCARSGSVLPIVADVGLAVVGFFLLNYTNGFGVAHHMQWAGAHSLPPPSPKMFYAGAALLAVGGFLLGRGRRRRSSAS